LEEALALSSGRLLNELISTFILCRHTDGLSDGQEECNRLSSGIPKARQEALMTIVSDVISSFFKIVTFL
jgi:hypothetical protein